MGFAYDSFLDRFFVYGGKNDINQAMDKTWKFDPTTSQWTLLSATTGIAHSSTRMVYHPNLEAPTSGRLVVYGGNGDPDTWFFDGGDSSTWTKCLSCRDDQLGARASEGMAFYPADAQNRVVVLFGGERGTGEDFTAPTNPQSDTWILTGATELAADWVQCTTPCATHPTARSSPGIAFYKVTNKAILFGGIGTVRQGDTWRYDQLALSNRWVQCTGTGCTPINSTQCSSGTLPPCTRYGHRMAFYDTASNKSILMFGGSHSDDTVLGDTWLFTGNPRGWVPCDPVVCLPPPNGPEARCCYGLTFDSVRNKVYLFGGSVPPQIANHRYKDLWTWTAAGGWHCESPLWCNIES